MKTPSIIVVVVVTAFSVFALLNWSAIAAPAELSLGFTKVRAPLGLVEGELRVVVAAAADARAEALARIDRLEERVMARLAEVGNGLAAHVAEVEDKLDRTARPGAPRGDA